MIRWLRIWYYRGLAHELELAVASEMRRAENLPATLLAWRQEIAWLRMKLDRLQDRPPGNMRAAWIKDRHD